MPVACSRCAAELPPTAKFCLECGSPVGPRTCPSCGAAAERGKFCGECGTALEATVAGAVPAQVPSREQPTAERRITTVLFGDLVGFTALSENRDAEDVRELLSRYFTGARTVVDRYGGTVEKFIGDAVMAVWGVPTAHEDDAERAVRAGLDLVAMTRAIGESAGAPALSMRVGLVTGEVAVTLGATDQGMVAGDAVNTASRVQSVATPGEVWVDDTTRSLTTAAISYSDAGNHELKGKAQPVQLFAAGSVMASVGGADRVDGLEAPITGRDREVRLLKELFHSTEEAKRPSLLVVEGEAGVGKSRIAWEFDKYVDGLRTRYRWHRGRCLAYGEGVAFWALAEAVRARLGLVEADAGPVVEERLDAGLHSYVRDPDERAWLRPRLAVLIGATQDSTFAREDLFAAWTTFLERVGEESMTVLAIDDAQHADDGLLDFLEYVLSAARSGVFILALARSGLLARRPSLAANPRTSVLHLGPLDDQQMATLVDGLVAGLPEQTRSLLVERAEGIPLFAVETVRGLIDRDIVVPRSGRYVLADGPDLDISALTVPASLQTLIAARLDALSVTERRVVADGSVLGLTFTHDGIDALDDDVADLDDVLTSLVRKQILSVETDRFSSERGQYRFVQAVVRQVAYETLSRRDRKARHLAVAAHLEQSDALGDNAPVLAQHYLDAVEASSEGDSDRTELLNRATAMLEAAAARARALGAPQEALRHLELALQIADAAPEVARLHESAAQVSLDSGAYLAAVEHGRTSITGYAELGQAVGAGRAAAIVGLAIARGQSDNAAAIELMRPHWERLHQMPGAEDALLPLAFALGTCHQDRSDAAEAMPYLERYIRLAEASGDPESLASGLVSLARLYAMTRAPITGRGLADAGATIARQHHFPLILSRALMFSGVDLLEQDVQAAIAKDQEALASAQQSGVVTWNRLCALNLALALWTGGRWDELARLLEEYRAERYDVASQLVLDAVDWWLCEARGIDRQLRSATPAADIDNKSDLSWSEHLDLLQARTSGDLAGAARHGAMSVAHAIDWSDLSDDFFHVWPPAVEAAIDAGDFSAADRLLQPVVEAPAGLVSTAVSSLLPGLRGQLAVARGEGGPDVESDLRAAISALDRWGAVPRRARAQEVLGRWLLTEGRADEAAEQLARARRTYDDLKARAWLDQLDPLSAHVAG